jgi:hypothetical protein
MRDAQIALRAIRRDLRGSSALKWESGYGGTQASAPSHHNVGYSLFSLMRGSAAVKRQLALAFYLLRSFSQAATFSAKACLVGIRGCPAAEAKRCNRTLSLKIRATRPPPAEESRENTKLVLTPPTLRQYPLTTRQAANAKKRFRRRSPRALCSGCYIRE